VGDKFRFPFQVTMAQTLRKVGLIGDIHGNDVFLERALGVLEAHGAELIAATGDVVDGEGSVDRCCALLTSHRVVTVKGNHERWYLDNTARELPAATPAGSLSETSVDLFEHLPTTIEFETSLGRALLCHGLGSNDMAKVTPDDYGYALASNLDLQRLLEDGSFRWVLNGHSHRRMVRSFGALTIINAGTLKLDRSPCFFLLDFEELVASLFEVDSKGQVESLAVRLSLVEDCMNHK
jgi:predicted phosphodiesterase